MATAVKSQIVPLAGCSQTKPPVPPKPLPGERKKPERRKSDLNVSSESPLPVGEIGHSNQAIAIAQQLRLKNSNTASTDEAKPSTSKAKDSDVTPKPKYVLKPLRQHYSFQEAKAKKHSVKRRSRDDGDTPSKIRDWLCLPLASFVVKTKDGGSSLIEKGKGRLFGKPRPKKPAPDPPTANLIPSRPKVPPRPVLQRILAAIDNGKGAGKWHKLENVKYIDEEVTTEDSTDYSDVDWGQAIHTPSGEESIIYYTYIEEGPNEKVIFYRSVARDEVLSSSEEEEEEEDQAAAHVALMEDMEIGVCEPVEMAPQEVASVDMNGHAEEEEEEISLPPTEVEATPKVEVSEASQFPQLCKNLSVIVEEEEAVRSPPPRPPSPRLPMLAEEAATTSPPPRPSSPRHPTPAASPSPILRMLSRTSSPKPETPREPSPVIIYEKFETKVKVIEEKIQPVAYYVLPTVEREVPGKTEPEYARVQKYSPPKTLGPELETPNEAPNVVEESTSKSEPYYDLDVAEPPPKVKPQRPPRPQAAPTSPTRPQAASTSPQRPQDAPTSPSRPRMAPTSPPRPQVAPPSPPRIVPPAPAKLAPPPVPPKTYMKVQFPPVAVEELVVDVELVSETMQAESREDLGVSETTIPVITHAGNGEEVPEADIEDMILEGLEENIQVEEVSAVNEFDEKPSGSVGGEANGFLEKSHLSLGEGSEMSDEKLRSALMLNETSESGFLSSPTPPPRNRRKRFRSMEGPVRGSLTDVGVPVPLRRSKSVSESENRKSWNSEASGSIPPKPTPPHQAAVKAKPARPPKPKITKLKKLTRSSEPDLASIVSSTEGSPPLVRMMERPLPPPPTPPRHRFPYRDANTASKTPDSMQMPISSNFPFEFLAKLSEIEAGKLSLNEINVKRINVQEIHADVVRTGSLQVGVVTPLVDVNKGKSDDDGDNDSGGKKEEKEEKSDDNEAINGNMQEKCDQVVNEDNQRVFCVEHEIDKVVAMEPTSQEDSQLTQEAVQETDTTNKSGDKQDEFMAEPQVSDQLIAIAVASEHRSSTFYLGEEDEAVKSASPAPSSTTSLKSGKKSRERQTSWYDVGVVPGQSGDIDTSDGRTVDSPTIARIIDSDTEAQRAAISQFSLANRSSERKKSGRIGRGSLQLYPREESPSSSSTTDPELEDRKAKHHRGSRSRSLSAGYTISPSVERRMPQLDPNANYCEEEVPNANLNQRCSGNGQCDSPPTLRRGDTEASPKLERIASANDQMKRLSLLSIPTSEDSWYNCTSGDESESEGSFGTAASCQDNSSSVGGDVRRTKKYFIARELMSSERVFVDALKLLNEDFRNVVLQANAKCDQKVIPVAVLDQILNYLPQLHNLNQDLLKDLQERIKNWEQLDQIADVITKKGPFLKLYSSYIKDFEMITSSLDEACKKYPLFAQVVKDFEMSERCNKLALKHFMLKPVQRIPQYKLILHEYLKHLNSDSPEYEDTVAALNIVTDVANHANQAMKQGDNFSKLLHIQNSITGGGYEVIRPGRLFLREGELSKLSRKVMQPRWFILFNDALLHTDVTQGSLRLHHELPLSGMRVIVPTNEEYLNEFSVISSTRSFTLSANSLQERDEWVSALTNAIKSNALRRGTFALAIDKPLSPQDEVGSTLGKHAPVWIPDSRVTMCQSCITPFTVTFRRHHCRACGKVVCATCSANRAPLQYLKFQSARVCDECFFRLAEAFDNTATESDCSTELASQSESGDPSTADIQRATLKAQFKRYATSGAGKKLERRCPRVLKEVGANHQGAAISGYLHKKTKKGWRRYWFVINDKVLYSYKASEDVAALESIPLLGFKLESNSEVFEGGDSNLGFQLIHPTHPLVFCGENEDATEKWKKEMHLATLLE